MAETKGAMKMMAVAEYHRVRRLAAFNVIGAKRRNVNQHMREYTFPDGSILRLYRDSKATVARAAGDYQTVIVGSILTNTFGR